MQLGEAGQAPVPAPESDRKRSFLGMHLAVYITDPWDMESDTNQRDELQRNKLTDIKPIQ